MGRHKSENKVGEENYNSSGQKMKLAEYIDSENVTIEFENGHIVKGAYKEFKLGNIKNPYTPNIFNVGYLGVGNYSAKKNKKNLKQYDIWSKMLKRCYDEKNLQKQPTYRGCSVCEEWHNYQNFAKWYDENKYEIDEEEMHVDKDILFKGNKIYSPDTCVFVPENINVLFTKNNIRRGNWPIGVYLRKSNNKYISQCSMGAGVQKYLGEFDQPEDAFQEYKECKEDLIKQIADEHLIKYPQFPQKLYEALYKYQVEITD